MAMDADGAGPVVVLVNPQMGENIGAAARAMWNFGLSRLRIVAPRDGWPNPRAVAMASGAGRVLDAARICTDTAEAVADLTTIYATTARPRDLTKLVLSPERAMADARARVAAGERVGILFGAERSGLENEDVIRASAIVTVPVNPAFPSLNLAQCVLLLGYEWVRAELPPDAGAVFETGRGRAATAGELARFLDSLEARLDARGFFWPAERRPSMQGNLRNLFARAALTDTDLQTLYGIVRSLTERQEGGAG